MTYNGWHNYETWVTALWIDNEESTQEESREILRAWRDSGGGYLVQAGDSLKEWAETVYLDPILEEHPASLAADLLSAAWSEINWREIAENWLEERHG